MQMTCKKSTVVASLAAFLFALGATGCATESREEAQLQAQSKISLEQAEQAALAQVPGGVIKDGDIEKDMDQLLWSFDIAAPGSTNLTEVNVDAVTGGVISVVTERSGQAEEKN
jgi:uncharacterized membrane protein YkoI